MNDALRITIASLGHLEILTGLAVSFRDQLGRSSPTSVDLAAGIRTLMEGGDAEFLMAVAKDGAGLGFAQLRYRYSMWLSACEACLEDLFVVPSHRRLGLGTSLIERALERASKRGCASVVVDTNERNIPAISLYSRLGFYCSSSRYDGGRQLWFRREIG